MRCRLKIEGYDEEEDREIGLERGNNPHESRVFQV